MISMTADYALRAIVFLADHRGQPHTTEAIAQGTKVPVGYLAKIMQGLSRHGLISSQRGLHGGFTLLRDPKELSLHAVIQAVDPIVRVRTCPVAIPGHGSRLCPLHQMLDDCMATTERVLEATTVADVLDPANASAALCAMRRANGIVPTCVQPGEPG